MLGIFWDADEAFKMVELADVGLAIGSVLEHSFHR